jgi:hypothetical protein
MKILLMSKNATKSTIYKVKALMQELTTFVRPLNFDPIVVPWPRAPQSNFCPLPHVQKTKASSSIVNRTSERTQMMAVQGPATLLSASLHAVGFGPFREW